MINRINENTALKFKTLTPEEKEKKGILGRLYGKVADFTNGTRNGRKYSEQLWENLLNSDLIKERFANGGIFGQLCHPDYEEVDMEKIACVMPEPPVKDKDGQLVAYVDILDTPCGRIAYQLAKYGYKLGISSRGTGDLITGPDGEEEVDPNTYQLNAFDLVEIPAVQNARLSFVESLDKKNSLRQSLVESLKTASVEDRKLMQESLDNLGIKLDESAAQELDKYYDEWKRKNPGVDFESLIKEYGKRLDEIMYSEEIYNDFIKWADTEKNIQIKGLDESLEEGYDNPWEEISDVLDRCVNNLDPEDLGDFLQGVIDQCRSLADEKGLLVENVDETSKTSSDIDKEEKEVVDDKSDAELVAEFQESLLKIKNLENDNLSLQEKLSVSNAKEVQLTEDVAKYKQATINLSDEVKSMKDLKGKVDKLTEELESKDKLLKLQESRVSKLRETNKSLSEELKNKDGDIPALQEKVKDLTESLEKITKQLESSKNLVEKYRASYKALKESYVESKAKNYGLSKEDVLQKLNESYKIKDIDSVCKELSKHKQKMGKLPFRITEDTKVNFKKSDNEYITGNNSGNPSDDYVSDSLLQLANF